MKFLLDENFPLALHRRLLAEKLEADHIITLGLRGISDTALRRRLLAPGTVLLTQDAEFLDVRLAPQGIVIVSRVPQALPLPRRVDLWLRAVREYVETQPRQQHFEILPDGRLVPWDMRRTSS